MDINGKNIAHPLCGKERSGVSALEGNAADNWRGVLAEILGGYFGLRLNLMYSALLAAALLGFGLAYSFAMAFAAVGLIALADGFGFGAQNAYFLRLPMISRLPSSRSLSVLSFIKKMAEMLGPLTFALAMGFPWGSGLLWMGILFLGASALAALTAGRGSGGANGTALPLAHTDCPQGEGPPALQGTGS